MSDRENGYRNFSIHPNLNLNLSEDDLIYFAAERSVPLSLLANIIDRSERNSGQPPRHLAQSIVSALRYNDQSPDFNYSGSSSTFTRDELIHLLCEREISASLIAQIIELSEQNTGTSPRPFALSIIRAIRDQIPHADRTTYYENIGAPGIFPFDRLRRAGLVGALPRMIYELPPTERPTGIPNETFEFFNVGNPVGLNDWYWHNLQSSIDNNDNAVTGDSTNGQPATLFSPVRSIEMGMLAEGEIGPPRNIYSDAEEGEMHRWEASSGTIEGMLGGGPMAFFRPGMVGPFSIEHFLCMDRPLSPLNATMGNEINRPTRIDPSHLCPQFIILLLLAILLPMGHPDLQHPNDLTRATVVEMSNSDTQSAVNVANLDTETAEESNDDDTE